MLEAVRQVVLDYKGVPSAQLDAALAQARPVAARVIGQAVNKGLQACAGPMTTLADRIAFLVHPGTVQFKHGILAGTRR